MSNKIENNDIETKEQANRKYSHKLLMNDWNNIEK